MNVHIYRSKETSRSSGEAQERGPYRVLVDGHQLLRVDKAGPMCFSSRAAAMRYLARKVRDRSIETV